MANANNNKSTRKHSTKRGEERMLKNVKRFTVVSLLVAVVMVVLATMYRTDNEDMKTVFGFSDELYAPTYQLFYDADYSWTKDCEKVDKDTQDSVNSICKDVCKFLNTEFGANWTSENITAYYGDVTESVLEQNKDHGFGAIYYEGKFYIDRVFIKDGITEQTKYIIAHELIHWLYDLNMGTTEFVLEDSSGRKCGEILHEAIVDSLAKQYVESEGTTDPEVTRGGYKVIRMMVDQIQLSNPDFLKPFFVNDIYGMQENFDKYVSQFVSCKGSPFEKMLSMMDDLYYRSDEVNNSISISVISTLIAIMTPPDEYDSFISIAKDIGLDFSPLLEELYLI